MSQRVIGGFFTVGTVDRYSHVLFSRVKFKEGGVKSSLFNRSKNKNLKSPL